MPLQSGTEFEVIRCSAREDSARVGSAGSAVVAFGGTASAGGVGGKAGSFALGGPPFAQSGLPALSCSSKLGAFVAATGPIGGAGRPLELEAAGSSLGVIGTGCQEPCPACSARWDHCLLRLDFRDLLTSCDEDYWPRSS